MPAAYQIENESACYFVTLQVVKWVDIFSRKIYKDLIVENLEYCQENKGLIIYGFVIMTNHIHMIIKSSRNNLSGTLRDFKSYTAKQIIEIINSPIESRKSWAQDIFKSEAYSNGRNSNFQFWTHENHAKIVVSKDFFKQKLQYIHENPVRSGFVNKAENYPYSSAANYLGKQGLLKINIIS